MALFKIFRGNEEQLPITKTDGYAYFCTDTGSFFIDHLNNKSELVRSKISANYADKLRDTKDGEEIELSAIDITTMIDNKPGKITQKNGEYFNDYDNNVATGNYSHAEGTGTTASGNYSHAEGASSRTLGNYSHAEGYNTVASGEASHAEGASSRTLGNYSHAEGYNTVASGAQSHAEGGSTNQAAIYIYNEDGSLKTNDEIKSAWNTNKFSLAKGDDSHVEGGNNLALGNYSHAEGQDTKASGEVSHAEGYNTTASGRRSHAEGSGTSAIGNYSHAEGINATASGDYSHAEGASLATNVYSHAEGDGTTASGNSSHAEGDGTIASGHGSHAEGYGTTASGYVSHAEGNGTTASGFASHAEGNNTIASGDNSHVQGKYNIEDTENKYAHIVGNGTSSNRSNAHTLDWNGNAWFAGNITVGANSDNVLTGSQESTVSNITNYQEVNNKLSINDFASGNSLIDLTIGGRTHCIANEDGTNTLLFANSFKVEELTDSQNYSLEITSKSLCSVPVEGNHFYQDTIKLTNDKVYYTEEVKKIYITENNQVVWSSNSTETKGIAYVNLTSAQELTVEEKNMIVNNTSIYANNNGLCNYFNCVNKLNGQLQAGEACYLIQSNFKGECFFRLWFAIDMTNNVFGITNKDSKATKVSKILSTFQSNNMILLYPKTTSLVKTEETTIENINTLFQPLHSNKVTVQVSGENGEQSITDFSIQATYHYNVVDRLNYINNQSGYAIKGFHPQSQTFNERLDTDSDVSGKIVLDSVEGIEVGMHYNIFYPIFDKTTGSHTVDKWRGEIIGVNSDTNEIEYSCKKFSEFKYEKQGCTLPITSNSMYGNMIIHGGIIGSFDIEFSKEDNVVFNAQGLNTKAGLNAHAEGVGTQALNFASHAEGYYTTATGERGHAEGYRTIASGQESHAEGLITEASGYGSHAEGRQSIAKGDCSHAEGYKTIASGKFSHAEGNSAKASGWYSHAEGWLTTASTNFSHTEGCGTTASGQGSHAEGYNTTASGRRSHAEGSGTTASGSVSHAEGDFTIASGEYSHVQGKYNIEDTENKYAHIVGNGTSSNRSNAHTLDWNGNAWFAGNVEATDLILSESGSIKENLEGKVDKIAGKGLSTNDFTDALLAKLNNNTLDGYYRFEAADESIPGTLFNEIKESGIYKTEVFYMPEIDNSCESGILFVRCDEPSGDVSQIYMNYYGIISRAYDGEANEWLAWRRYYAPDSDKGRPNGYAPLDANGLIPVDHIPTMYPTVQTAITDTITVNTIYNLGLQSDLSITLPSGQHGDFIQFDFVSGATATSITVSSSSGILGYDLVPETNKIYSLYFDWGVISCDTSGVLGYGWRSTYSEYDIALTESTTV